MFNNRRKLILITCLLLGIPFLVGCSNQGQSPIRSLTITIEPSQREELFDQLRRFADKHSFEYLFTDYGTNGQRFTVELLRKDIKILAVDVYKATEMVDIDFYDQSFATKASEDTMTNIDELATDLKTFLNEIPNGILTEQRKSLRITLDESQREELFAQMEKLAKEYSLEFQLSLSSDKTLFHAEIHGEGFHITIDPVVGSPREISMVFFIDYHKAPTSTSLETIDELSNELKSLLGEIPNVTIAEEQ
jgi:regulator of replication initiation timing